MFIVGAWIVGMADADIFHFFVPIIYTEEVHPVSRTFFSCWYAVVVNQAYYNFLSAFISGAQTLEVVVALIIKPIFL